MLNAHIIGNKHFPEHLLIKSKTKHINKHDRREFDYDYETLISRGYIIRQMKRTGKGSEWHISINPHKIDDIKEMM